VRLVLKVVMRNGGDIVDVIPLYLSTKLYDGAYHNASSSNPRRLRKAKFRRIKFFRTATLN